MQIFQALALIREEDKEQTEEKKKIAIANREATILVSVLSLRHLALHSP